jgi:hypothetical protein
MKKSTLIISTVFTTVSLMAFGCENPKTEGNEELTTAEIEIVNPPSEVTFFYEVASRFMSTVTKEKLHNSKSILDFLPKSQTDPVVNYQSVEVIILNDYHQTDARAKGKDDRLTEEQLELIKTVDYSNNILIRAEFEQKNKASGKLGYNYFTPHITIVPEKEAMYIYGNGALINYLKERSKEKIALVEPGKLKGGKLYFTVTKDGDITNIELAATSGYPTIDETMHELIKNTPGKFIPAENANGEKVEQKLVFSFGTIGC